MDYYEHRVVLEYQTSEQLNRHASRLIDKEGFMSAGPGEDGEYRFCKILSKGEFAEQKLLGKDVKEVTGGDWDVFIVEERRVAW